MIIISSCNNKKITITNNNNNNYKYKYNNNNNDNKNKKDNKWCGITINLQSRHTKILHTLYDHLPGC